MEVASKSSNTSGSVEPSSIPKHKFATRANKTGTQVYWGPPDEIRKDENLASVASSSLYQWSNDGTLIVFITDTGFAIYESETGKLVQQVTTASKINAVHISPRNTYVTTWERFQKENTQNNLIIWEVSSGKQVVSFIQKVFSSELWPSIKWSDDESFCGRLVPDEVIFWNKKDLGSKNNVSFRLSLPDITKFSIAPGPAPHKIAAFVKEKKGAPAFVRLFRVASMEVISSKSFYKAQEVDLVWNDEGSALLVFTHTDMDKTGKSYYGETGLHYLSTETDLTTSVVLKKEGPIYDVCWSPSSKEFAVVYGFMPAQTTIFDTKCQPIADLGQASRNTAKWSPNGRLLCVAGFGNVQGYMDVWDHKKLKKVGTMQANCSSHYEWSPDSRYILTGVLSPRIRVDNGFKVWKYDGSQIYSEAADELLQVSWRPTPSKLFPDRPPSPRTYATAKAAEAEATQKSAKYVPPHLAGRASPTIKKADVSAAPVKYKYDVATGKQNINYLPPGYDESDNINKKKKSKKPKKPTEGTKEEEKKVVAAPAFEISEPESEADVQKKLRMISKKLRQIDGLKEQQAEGKELDPAQLEKIAEEKDLRERLKSLSVKN